MRDNEIREIVESIEHASEALPEMSGLAGFALRSITASARRATMPESRLSAAASLSIASAAMSFAVAALTGCGWQAVTHVSPVVRAAIALRAGNLAPEHVAGAYEEAPEGWDGARGGPFFAVAPGGESLVLTRRPRLPGGDWTVHIEGIPLAFGKTAAEAADRGTELARIVSESPAKEPS